MLMLSLILVGIATSLVFLYKDRHVGLATVLLGVIIAHSLSGLLLQTLGVFTRPLLIGVYILVLLVSWYVLFRYRTQLHVPRRSSWPTIAAIILAVGIVGYQFYAVHFSYTGIANTILGETYVTEDAYPYPLFSDEWVAIAVAGTAIENQSLPFIHPFTDAAYQNFLFVFHSFIASVGLFFGEALATTYVWVGIFVSTIIAGLLFTLWRSVGVSFGIALLGMLLVPYVVGGSNLPLLWYLLPWNMGFVLMLIAFIFFAKKQLSRALVSLGVSVAMYPPFIVFAIPVLVGAATNYTHVVRKRIWIMLTTFTIGAPILFILGIALFTDLSLGTSAQRFFEVLIRPLNSAYGSVPTFLPWHVLPYFLLPFVFYGGWVAWRTMRYVVLPVLLGGVIWLVNPLVDTTFFIDYHRVVVVTALLALILSVIGVYEAWHLVKARYAFVSHNMLAPVFVAIVLILFLCLVPSYTARDGWRNFTVTYYDASRGLVTEPAPAPVNRYVHPDDLEIFSMISNERFLAPGWKGLVLGVLTSNDPVFTKPSTITMKTIRYTDFLLATCEEKIELLRAAKVGYVYSEKVNCPGFESLAVSGEGLHLSRVLFR